MTNISDDRLREIAAGTADVEPPFRALPPPNPNEIFSIARELLSLRTSPPPSGEAGEVRVKPLEWQFEGGTFFAKSVAGRYSIIRRDGDWLCLHEGLSVGYFDDGAVDPVKAAAQSDYETRIRSALLPTIKEPTDGK